MMHTTPILWGQRAVFIPHDGFARGGVEPIELPSRIVHRPTIQIQKLVAASYGIHPRHMVTSARDRRYAWPRQIAMYLARKLTDRSLPAIGEEFGHRHHTTVLHAIRTVERRMTDDPVVMADIEAFFEALLA